MNYKMNIITLTILLLAGLTQSPNAYSLSPELCAQTEAQIEQFNVEIEYKCTKSESRLFGKEGKYKGDRYNFTKDLKKVIKNDTERQRHTQRVLRFKDKKGVNHEIIFTLRKLGLSSNEVWTFLIKDEGKVAKYMEWELKLK